MPTSQSYVDVHTHKKKLANPLHFQLTNIFAHEEIPKGGQSQKYSVGIHPWHIEQTDLEESLAKIYLDLQKKQVIAIGEAGLDRVIKTDFELQKAVFIEQIKLAEKFELPVIVHCVRAYPEMISIKKRVAKEIKFILHGFNGNQQNFEQLSMHGFFFSFGKDLIDPNSKIRSIFAQVSEKHFFLETDEASISIEEVYDVAAKIKQLEISKLKLLVKSNFEDCFGKILE